MTSVIAIPVKDLVNAKQRLMPILSADERRELAGAMLEDVLDGLGPGLADSVLIVTRDAAATAVARRRGVACLSESANRGHTEAVAAAQREAVAAGVDRFLTIPGDVPCVTHAEVRALFDALGGRPGAAFVPSASGFGTNAALLVPPDAMPLRFGEPSFQNHLDGARARGLDPTIVRLPGLGLDVDSPEDLLELLRRGAGTRSGRLAAAWGIPVRLSRPA